MGRPTKNILILSPFFRPNIGGVETHLDDLCEYLRLRDWRVHVLTYQPLTTCAKGPKYERKNNLTIYRISWFGHNWFHRLEPYPLLEFLYLTPGLFIRTLFFLIKNSNKINVIHAHGFTASAIAVFLKKLFKKRVIIGIHSIYGLSPSSYISKFITWMLKQADRVLTLSIASKEELIRLGLPEDKIGVYTYWVDSERFAPMPQSVARERLGWQPKFTVLFVGRLIEKKGVDILIEAAKKIEGNIAFVFIGDGLLSGALREAAKDSLNITYLGKINNYDLPFYYNAADILCVPSKYDEGFGRVIIESLLCGTPVVASKKGGIPEAIDDSVGILVEPGVEYFKKAILELAHNTDKLGILKGNCRGYAVRKFGAINAEAIVNNY